MTISNRVMNYSLLAALCMAVTADSFAAIRVGNKDGSYASSYKNTLGLQQQYQNYLAETQQSESATATTNSADGTNGLPVRVADADMAARIQRGDANAETTIEHLNNCAILYPDGEFMWDKPTLGHMAGGPATCVAVVEMRVRGQVNNGQEYVVAARGKLAAGDAMRCNISEFPESTYLADIVKVEFPSDEKPTREDVIKVMNEEQKNKAGLKIGGAFLVGLVGGNALGKGEPGSEKVFGLNSDKIKTSLIGGVGAAGLMAASTYSGKVAGDMILSAGTNAAAGAVTGNMYDAMTGSGDTLLHIEKCRKQNESVEVDCLWGTFRERGVNVLDNSSDKYKGKNAEVYYNVVDKKTMLCLKEGGNAIKCSPRSDLILGNIEGSNLDGKEIKVSALEGKNVNQILPAEKRYSYDENSDSEPFKSSPEGQWVKISGANESGKSSLALVYNYPESRKGTTSKDFDKWKSGNFNDAEICLRDSKGDAYQCKTGKDYSGTGDFKPITKSSSDGAIVDLSDKTRKKDTLKGAAVGAGIGGFSAYQGAQEDIDARYVQSMDEYEASLMTVTCDTGRKFLSYYNSDVEIPRIEE